MIEVLVLKIRDFLCYGFFRIFTNFVNFKREISHFLVSIYRNCSDGRGQISKTEVSPLKSNLKNQRKLREFRRKKIAHE